MVACSWSVCELFFINEVIIRVLSVRELQN